MSLDGAFLGSPSLGPKNDHRPSLVSGMSAGPLTSRNQKYQALGGINFARMLDSRERSKEFEGVPVSEEEIKKMPKKLRPYYENLALIHEHYCEVDALLASSVPSAIATSFKPAQSSYTRLVADLEEEYGDYNPQEDSRRHSNYVHDQASNGNGNMSKVTFTASTKAGDGDSMDPGERMMTEEDGLLGDEEEGKEGRDERRDRVARFALNVNFGINLVLLASKGLAVLSSSSISLVASFVDAALDFLSTIIILGTSLAMGRKSDTHLYPVGKRRFEPLGVLIFSVAMIASFFQVFIESFQRAIGKSESGEVAELSWFGIGTMVATIVIKSAVWVWCSSIPSSSVKALAQDAENDVFFNVMSLAFPWIGQKLGWRLLDPIGGMILSAYIIFEWIKTLHENFQNLSGKGASSDHYTRILYLCTRFKPILKIGAVECYHIGDELIVEVDAILSEHSSLHYAHDVSETCQCLLENLDSVARSYVHMDCDAYNPPQHTVRTGKKAATRTPSPTPSGNENRNPEGVDGGEEGDYGITKSPGE